MPSATGGIARLVYARLRGAGIEPAPLLSRAGLTVAQIEDRSARLKVHSQIRFLELGAEALQDDCLGFHLVPDYELGEIGLFYYVLASSDTIADALGRAERYSGIVNEGISLRCRAGNETAIALVYVDVERRSDRHQIEFWLMSLVRLFRQLTNRRLVPSRRATSPASALPCGSNGAIAFSTLERSPARFAGRCAKASSLYLISSSLRCGSALTTGISLTAPGKTISSASEPNSISHPRNDLNSAGVFGRR